MGREDMKKKETCRVVRLEWEGGLLGLTGYGVRRREKQPRCWSSSKRDGFPDPIQGKRKFRPQRMLMKGTWHAQGHEEQSAFH